MAALRAAIQAQGQLAENLAAALQDLQQLSTAQQQIHLQDQEKQPQAAREDVTAAVAAFMQLTQSTGDTSQLEEAEAGDKLGAAAMEAPAGDGISAAEAADEGATAVNEQATSQVCLQLNTGTSNMADQSGPTLGPPSTSETNVLTAWHHSEHMHATATSAMPAAASAVGSIATAARVTTRGAAELVLAEAPAGGCSVHATCCVTEEHGEVPARHMAPTMASEPATGPLPTQYAGAEHGFHRTSVMKQQAASLAPAEAGQPIQTLASPETEVLDPPAALASAAAFVEEAAEMAEALAAERAAAAAAHQQLLADQAALQREVQQQVSPANPPEAVSIILRQLLNHSSHVQGAP